MTISPSRFTGQVAVLGENRTRSILSLVVEKNYSNPNVVCCPWFLAQVCPACDCYGHLEARSRCRCFNPFRLQTFMIYTRFTNIISLLCTINCEFFLHSVPLPFDCSTTFPFQPTSAWDKYTHTYKYQRKTFQTNKNVPLTLLWPRIICAFKASRD